MKKILYSLFLLLISTNVGAQSRLWISGSAVPGGIQELEKFPTKFPANYTFKFHGTLLPGTLYIQTTETLRATTRLLGPTLVDVNLVNDGLPYRQYSYRDSTKAGWNVLFEADNYRFTVTPSSSTLKGELFTWWYEAWIVGGCTAEGQEEKWLLEKGLSMEQSLEDPYEWVFVGELKDYTANVESKRLKINGQGNWNPKSLHPFKQDAPLSDGPVWYNATDDYKWAIGEDGYYLIAVNVFKETMRALYLGNELPDGIRQTRQEKEIDVDMLLNGRQIALSSASVMTARLFTIQGNLVDTQSGQQFSLEAAQPGVYILTVKTTSGSLTRKIRIS